MLTDDKAKEALDNLLRLRRDRELRYRRENERRLELVRELEEKERADQAAARESYREMRDAMVQMQVEADKLAEAQREAPGPSLRDRLRGLVAGPFEGEGRAVADAGEK